MTSPDKTFFYSHRWDRRLFDAFLERAELRPTKLHLQVTRRCSHRCITCNHHLAPAGGDDLSTAQLLRLLEQGRDFGMTNLSLTGGEPMLRQDLLEVVSQARDIGYSTITVATNGDLLTDAGRVRAVLEAGATHLPISLHGLETHDEIVAAPGSRERVMRAVDLLLSLTDGDADRVTVGMVAMDRTLDQLDAMADYCRRVGCGLRVNVLDSTLFFFSDGTRTSELRPRDRSAIERFITRCFELSDEGLLRLWPRNIVFMERYLLGEPIESPCPVGLEALYVAHDGRFLPGCWASDTGATTESHEIGELWADERFRDALFDAFHRRCPGCGCTFRTMSAWYAPYIVEGWLRAGW